MQWWLWLAGTLGALIASSVFYSMMRRVNSRLPHEKRIGVLWGHPGTLWTVLALDRQHFPESSSGRVLIAIVICTLALWAAGVLPSVIQSMRNPQSDGQLRWPR
jgi:hypothetical protein